MAIREKYAHLPPLPADTRQRLARVPELLARHPVRLAYLFGSAAQNPERANDIDLAVVPDKGYSFPTLYADLSLLLGTDRLEIVELPAAPYWLQEAIVRTGERLYARAPCDPTRFEAGILLCCNELRQRQRRLATVATLAPMEVNRDFLVQVAWNLRRTADELDKHARRSADDLATDLTLCWAVQHGLLAGITLILQAAQHILTRRFGTVPESYEASLAELRAHGVISAALYRRLRGAGGFRNVLVHEYLEIDLTRIAQYARRAPRTFRDFADELTHWLNQA